jgi:hypothetical protein
MGSGFLGEGLIGSNFLSGLFQGALSPDLSKKISTQNSYSTQSTTSNVSNITTNRSYDFQYNIADNGSSISTKKEMASSQSPNVSPVISPQILQIPTTSQSGSGFGGSAPEEEGSFGSQVLGSTTGIIVIGLIIGGAYLFLKKK